MHKILSLVSTLLFVSFSCWAQIPGEQPLSLEKDSIRMEKVRGGYRCFQGSKELNQEKLATALKTNNDAYWHMESAKSSATVSRVLGYAGGFLIGWPIGTAIGGGSPNWALAGIGAGAVGVAIPLSVSANKKMKRAVDIYNEGLKNAPTTSLIKEVGIGLAGNGIGLVIKL